MISLDTALADATRVGIDSAPLIYFVESHPVFETIPVELVRRANAGQIDLVTSVLTLTEVLVIPIRQGARKLVAEYRDVLLNSDQIEVVALSAAIAETAARLRASYDSLRTPDAVHLATAIEARCGAFLTNDKRLRRISEINVLCLHDLTL